MQKEKLLKEREKQAEDAVYKAKREAAIAITEANNREKVAKQAQEAAKKLTKEQEKIIRDKSNEQYEDFKMRYDTLATIVILYAVTVTIGLAVTSERIKADTIAFVKTIAFLFEGYYETACKLTTAAAGVGSGIQQPVVSVIITYLLGGIVALLCIAFILAGISSVGWLVYHVYQKYCWDEISPFVSLMSLAIVVSFASIMPLNIYLLLILSQIAYMIIRWLWEIKAIQGLFERIATRIEKWLDLKPNQQIGDLIIVFVIVVAVLTVRSWIKG